MALRFRLRKGCGSHTLRDQSGRVTTIRPGDIITVEKSSLASFLDKFDQLDPDPPDPDPKRVLKVVPRPGKGGWYDVVNTETGKPINDVALRRDAAEEMAE